MEYNEEKAQGIIEKFGLKESVKRVWKSRNEIPKKYANPNFFISNIVKEDGITQKLREVLSFKELVLVNFRTNEINPNYNVSSQRAHDIKKGASFIEEEILGYKDEITEIRNKCRKILDTKTDSSVKKLLADNRVKASLVVDKKIIDKLNYGSLLQKYEMEEVVINISYFYNKLRI